MGTEGAGGLSTTAIERCIDNWETETRDGAEIPAAHAELAALVGRVAALEGALLDETARRLWTERVLQDRHSYPTGWDWDVGPAVREHWTRVARGRLGHARTVETLAELLARRDADAGRARALAAALRHYAERGRWSYLSPNQRAATVLRVGDLIAFPDGHGWEVAERALADAGRGAAGARDETAARVSEAAQEFRRSWDEWEAGRHWVRFRRREEARAALWAALDALRAGGAGVREGDDG
jgi:hypothetical protein